MSEEITPAADQTADAKPALRPDSTVAAAACTIISKNYLAYARTIAKAFARHHPDHPFFVLLVDRLDGYFNPDREPFQLIPIERLDIPNLQRFTFQYSILELNTAVKPYFLEHLLTAHGLSRVVYFDPDILITADVSHLFRLLGDSSILLTPHLTAPIDDGHKPSELDILRAGVYNLGFIGVAASPTTSRFLHWWKERLYTKCQIAHDQGMFVDQRWVDLVPGLFDDVHILKDPAYNVAYWNLHSRRVEFDGVQVTVNGTPCRFFHFSGFDPRDMSTLSKHQTRFSMRTFESVARLFDHYRGLLNANGYAESRQWPYAFGSFSNGTRVPDIVRVIYRDLGDGVTRFGDPFRVDGPSAFASWLWESVDGYWGAPRTVSRFWYEIYQQRADLQAAYPDVLAGDRDAFIDWTRTTGAAEYMIDGGAQRGRPSAISWLYARFVVPFEPVLAPTLQRLTRHRSRLWSRIRRLRSLLRAARPAAPRTGGLTRPALGGVNVAGYFASEKGVGAAVRSTVGALQAASVPCVLSNVVDSGSRNREGREFEYRPDNPYLVNLLHVNADQAPMVASTMGAEYFRGRYNIGAWFWELSRFPAEWRSSFRYFQEIWTYSSFCLDAVSRVSPIPVVRMPLAVAPPAVGQTPGDRVRYGIGPDQFLFLFMFDFHSVVERKNPLGVIRAFELAFGARRDVGLLVKTAHSADNPAELAQLRAAVRTDTVKILDDVLSRAEVMNLLAACDCYVSLHRSEGFGLPIAEAMALGKPVIVTAYSGNMDFTTPSNSFLVKYRLVELGRTHGPYQEGSVWADPDVEHAAELMRHVCEARGEAQRIAVAGQRDVETLLHPRVVGAQMRARLDEIWTGGTAVTVRSASLVGSVPSGRTSARATVADARTMARPAVAPGAPPVEERVDADLAGLHSAYDVSNVPLLSHRAWLGPGVVLVKRVLRRLLIPILSQQAAYNASNARVVTWLAGRVEDLIGREREFRALEKRLARQRRMVRAVGGQVARGEEALKTLEHSSRSLEYRLRGALDELSQVSVDRQGLAGVDRALGPAPHLAAFDSLGFHDRFRGGQDEIRERQRQYVEHFSGAKQVLDIGCGRGEFLELLKEAGIEGRGIERSLRMATLCREKGLDVAHGDAFELLAGLPDESLDGIFSAQVIEHLRPGDVLRLVLLCHAKLRPGGVVVLETVNVQCVSVFARSFYMDFTHVWPCHPDAMRYVLESAGFRDTRLTFSSPVDPEAELPILPDQSVFGEATTRFNKAARLLNELVLGYQDYAVIGHRS